VLCLQEVEVTGFMMYMTLSIIWLETGYFFFVHVDGKGGVVIWKKRNNDLSNFVATSSFS
jgi:hypothetical protein